MGSRNPLQIFHMACSLSLVLKHVFDDDCCEPFFKRVAYSSYPNPTSCKRSSRPRCTTLKYSIQLRKMPGLAWTERLAYRDRSSKKAFFPCSPEAPNPSRSPWGGGEAPSRRIISKGFLKIKKRKPHAFMLCEVAVYAFVCEVDKKILSPGLTKNFIELLFKIIAKKKPPYNMQCMA